MIVFVIGALIVILVYILNETRKPENYPPGPSWIPHFGSSLLLSKLSRAKGGHHLALQDLAKQFNTKVLGMKLGPERVVVVFSFPFVKQILTSEEYDGRPDNFFIRLRCMGTRKGITTVDGELWKVQRRFVVHHLRDLGFGKGYMEDMVQKELDNILKIVEQKHHNSKIVITKLFPKHILNVLWILTAGSHIPESKLNKLFELMERRTKVFDMSGGILNQFPWLRYIAPEKTGYKIMLNLNKELKDIFLTTINEHKRTWTSERRDDLIYAFITEMKENVDEISTFTDDQLVMVCADLFIAGSKTTSTFLDSAFLMMALYPEIQAEMQKELDSYYKNKKNVEYSDKQNLLYTKAVLSEIERYCHVTPIIGPRRVLRDTTLGGFKIPKDTTVLISCYSVHMDEEYWKDPFEFQPKRFLQTNGQINNTERLIPFGLGRRRCLGEALARSCMFTFFVGVLKEYEVALTPESEYLKKEKQVFVPGILLSPKPYSLLFTKRNV